MRGSFRLGGVIALPLIAGAVAYWFLAPAPKETAAVAPVAGEEALETRAGPAPLELERGEVEAVAAPPGADAPAATSAEATQPTLELCGCVIVSDLDGRVREDLDGEFKLVLWHGGSGQSEQVEFVGGAWTASIAVTKPIAGLSVWNLLAGEQAAVVDDPSERVDMPASGELTIRAHVPPAVVLRVTDRATGADLHGVSLVRADSSPYEDAKHPGLEFEERTVATGLASPIDLGPHAVVFGQWDTQPVLVGVLGYAWSLVEVDFALGAERTVALERGAELSILVRGVDPRAAERLRLRAADVSTPLLDLALTADGAIELDSLAPGEVSVAVEVGAWFQDPLVLGERSALLRAGERASVTLDLAPAPVLELADVAGVMHVAKGWNQTWLNASLELIGTALGGVERRRSVEARRAESTREGYDAFRWQCARVQVGRHLFELFTPTFCVVLDVPPGGRDDFEFVLEAPVELLVLIVDDATDEALSTAQLNWIPQRPVGAGSFGWQRSHVDAEHGRHVIRTFPTTVDLMFWSNDYLPYSGEVDLKRGVREHTIRLQRAPSIEVTLRSAGTRLPIPADWNPAPSAPDSAGATHLISVDSSWRRTFVVTEPGVYELVPPRIPGYRELPVQRIEVLAGRTTEHVIEYELERP
jgi:hypothetical protein